MLSQCEQDLIVLFLTVLTIGVWVWSNGQAKQIGGPAEMTVAPDGHLYVQMMSRVRFA